MKLHFNLLFIAFAFLALGMITSCQPDHEYVDPRPGGELRIQFSPQTISIMTVDSAVISFIKPGTVLTQRDFSMGQSTLTIHHFDLPPGSWLAEIKIYIKDANNRKVMYKTSLDLQNPLSADKVIDAPPAPGNATWEMVADNGAELAVTFFDNSMPVTRVDSVNVTFSKPGGPIEKIRGIKNGERYVFDISSLQSGNWSALFIVYAKAADQTKRQYHDTMQLSLPYTGGTIAGPSGTIGDNWENYISMKSGEDISILIPEDNTNPYFEIRVSDPTRWAFFYLDRYAYNKVGTSNQVVESASWDCDTQCYNLGSNAIVNTTAFSTYATRLRAKPWNSTEIMVHILGTALGDDLTFFYKYDK